MINNKRLIYLMFFVIIIISLVYRIDYLIENKDYWHDESFQNLYSQKSIIFILDSTDVHPPLFTLLTKGIVAINDSIIFTRTFSIICSVLFLISVFIFCKNHLNEITGLVACLLFAILPTWIHYSIEFRSYMFTFIFVVIQMNFFINMLKDNSKKNNLIFILLSALLLNLHYFTGFYLLGQFIYLFSNVIVKNFRKNWCYLLNYLFITILCLPLFYYLFNTIIKIESFWFQEINILSFISSISFTLVQPNLYGIFTFIFFVIIILLLYLVNYEAKFKLSKEHKLLLFSYFIPLILVFLISQFKPIYHHRYFLFGGIFLIIFIADLMGKIMSEEPTVLPYMCSLIILIVMLCFASFGQMVDNRDIEIQDSINFLGNVINNDNINNSYLLVHTSPFTYTPYIYYSKLSFNNTKNVNNILLTNLTHKILFTMGGSVINKGSIYYNEEQVKNKINNNTYIYFISDKAIKEVVVWEQNGLTITRNQNFGMEKQQI